MMSISCAKSSPQIPTTHAPSPTNLVLETMISSFIAYLTNEFFSPHDHHQMEKSEDHEQSSSTYGITPSTEFDRWNDGVFFARSGTECRECCGQRATTTNTTAMKAFDFHHSRSSASLKTDLDGDTIIVPEFGVDALPNPLPSRFPSLPSSSSSSSNHDDVMPSFYLSGGVSFPSAVSLFSDSDSDQDDDTPLDDAELFHNSYHHEWIDQTSIMSNTVSNCCCNDQHREQASALLNSENLRKAGETVRQIVNTHFERQLVEMRGVRREGSGDTVWVSGWEASSVF